jgi:hypothetical protein
MGRPKGLPFSFSRTLGYWIFLVGCWIFSFSKSLSIAQGAPTPDTFRHTLKSDGLNVMRWLVRTASFTASTATAVA